MPFADKLPKPEEVVASAYDFAEQLLASQRKFAEEVLKATSALMPGTRTAPSKPPPRDAGEHVTVRAQRPGRRGCRAL